VIALHVPYPERLRAGFLGERAFLFPAP